MAVTQDYTFVNGEILTAALLNTEFANVYNNGEDLGWPATKTKVMAGNKIDLDVNADTSLSAAVNDIIVFEIQGQSLLTLDGSITTAVNGFKMTMNDASASDSAAAAGTLAAVGSDTNIDFRVDPKGAGVFNIGGVNAGQGGQAVLAQWFFAG